METSPFLYCISARGVPFSRISAPFPPTPTRWTPLMGYPPINQEVWLIPLSVCFTARRSHLQKMSTIHLSPFLSYPSHSSVFQLCSHQTKCPSFYIGSSWVFSPPTFSFPVEGSNQPHSSPNFFLASSCRSIFLTLPSFWVSDFWQAPFSSFSRAIIYSFLTQTSFFTGLGAHHWFCPLSRLLVELIFLYRMFKLWSPPLVFCVPLPLLFGFRTM